MSDVPLILAVDPGPIESAFVVWDGASIGQHGKLKNGELAHFINGWSQRNTLLVIEMIASYGMPVGAEVFETCVWIGRFMETWRGREPMRVTRGMVKNHICHSSKAKDSNVRQALIDRFGAPGTKKAPGVTYGLSGDTWAAFAVAVYIHDLLSGVAD